MELEMTEREKRVREKLRGKKIVCYGVSASYIAMNELLDLDESVAFFADRDQSKWGRFYYGKEVKSPDEMSRLDKRTYIIVVFVRSFEPVYKLLNDMGFEHKVNYIHISELLGARYELVKFINAGNRLLTFLNTVPKEIKKIAPQKESPKIGIVASMEGVAIAPEFPYSVVLFLILKWRGYHVQLIMDNLCWTVDTDLYEGCYADLQHISNQIIEKLEEIIPKSDILYMDAYGKNNVMEDAEQECEKIAEYSAGWQNWLGFHAHLRTTSVEQLRRQFAEAFKRNVGYVDAFFEANHYDTIHASTGLHKRAGVIAYIGKKKGIRVSSQDGTGEVTLLGTERAASHGGDVARTLEESWITKKQEQYILRCAQKMAEERFKQENTGIKLDLDQFKMEVQEKGYANVTLQPIKKRIERIYDVVIPLNVPHDASMLGLETFFRDKKEWLTETLDLLINQLERTVLLREHPLLRLLSEQYSYGDIARAEPDILEPYQKNRLLHYANFDEDINLYQYIEQCKLVLPWSSTVGMEAAIMEKSVIVHTNVFYGDSDFALKAHSKKEYFFLVKKCMESGGLPVANREKAKREALKYFYFDMNRRLKTKFTLYGADLECLKHEWMDLEFKELLEEKGIDEIIKIVADNIPSTYLIAQQDEFT